MVDQINWYKEHRPDLTEHENIVVRLDASKKAIHLALISQEKLKLILARMLDETEFLSDYGIRSLSKAHPEDSVKLMVDGECYGSVGYVPAESKTGAFGGNSNWRGPIWFPVNYLIIQSLRKFHRCYGDDFTVAYPTGSTTYRNLHQVSMELSQRLIKIFMRDPTQNERRPVYGGIHQFQTSPYWRDYILFYEYFHGDNGAGLGASHQTGWTGLIANLIQQFAENEQ